MTSIARTGAARQAPAGVETLLMVPAAASVARMAQHRTFAV